MGHLASWPEVTVNESLLHGIGASNSYLDEVWQLAYYAEDGATLIAVDLNPDGFGRIGLVTYSDALTGGACVIAESFEDWIERTLDLGPEAETPYWYQPGFKDLGPLIPHDQGYRPFHVTKSGEVIEGNFVFRELTK